MLEVAFPAGARSAPSGTDLAYMEDLLKLVKQQVRSRESQWLAGMPRRCVGQAGMGGSEAHLQLAVHMASVPSKCLSGKAWRVSQLPAHPCPHCMGASPVMLCARLPHNHRPTLLLPHLLTTS